MEHTGRQKTKSRGTAPSPLGDEMWDAMDTLEAFLPEDRSVMLVLPPTDDRKRLDTRLKEYHYDTVQLDTPQQAISTLKERSIGCLVIGTPCSGISELEFIEIVRSTSRHAFTPIIVLTHNEDLDEMALLRAGADACCQGEKAQRLLLRQLAILLC